MVKNKTTNNKKAIKKNNGKKNKSHNKSINTEINKNNIAQNIGTSDSGHNLGSEYKKELLEVDKDEEKYNKLFEQKLAEQYKEFRNIKEHHMQSRKFLKILAVIITIILIALLILSYS